MKTNMMRCLAVAVVAAMVASTAVAYAGEGWSGPGKKGDKEAHFNKMAENLGLTADQKAALERQREEFGARMKGLREKIGAARTALREELDKVTPDTARIASLVTELKNHMGEQIQGNVDKMLAMKKVLTAEQQAKMKTLREERKAEWGKKRAAKSEKGGRGEKYGPPPTPDAL